MQSCVLILFLHSSLKTSLTPHLHLVLSSHRWSSAYLVRFDVRRVVVEVFTVPFTALSCCSLLRSGVGHDGQSKKWIFSVLLSVLIQIAAK